MLKVDPLHNHCAGEATGIDLSAPLARDAVAEIEAAMDRYTVLVFRGQPLTQDQQVRMTRSFGPLDLGLKKVKKQADRLQYAELADISNVGVDGRPVDRNHRKVVGNIANQLWHSDSSFQKPAARYSMLSAVVTPSWGGDTEFADMRAAYDGLTQEMKQEIAPLEAEHYALHSRFLLGDEDYSEEQRNAIPPATWPLVRTHAGSGRTHLFIGVHARGIHGMTVAEGRMLLSDLQEHATQPQFIYRHRWEVGDLVMWDNRCTLHRGRRYDLAEPRELRRSTTEDTDRAVAAAA